MKKRIITMLAAGCFAAVVTTSCGEKFKPMTQEQINNTVDSVFNSQKDAKLQELRAACQSGLQAQVDAKVEAMKGGETAGK